MIVASLKDDVLRVEGHSSQDSRVCAAVSAIAGTLYAGYHAEAPLPGEFACNFNTPGMTGVRDFVCNMLRLLARQYPAELSFQE